MEKLKVDSTEEILQITFSLGQHNTLKQLNLTRQQMRCLQQRSN